DSDQPVLAQIAEVGRRVTVGSEVVRIDRAKQRVVGIRIPAATQPKRLEPRLGAGRRELETVGWHVTVGARSPVAGQALGRPVEKRAQASYHGMARLARAFDGRGRRCDTGARAGRA